MVSFMEFKSRAFPCGCLSVYTTGVLFKDFDRNNLTRWVEKGLLLRLRRGWYAFPEHIKYPDFSRYVAGQIYGPSYISLQTALNIYGIIPEAVTDIMSVTARKTAHFDNAFGRYFYQTVRREMIFGFKPVTMPGAPDFPARDWWLALPEKAILDFLYLYPFYKTEQDMLELRFDEWFMAEELDRERLGSYLERMQCKALERRVNTLLRAYD